MAAAGGLLGQNLQLPSLPLSAWHLLPGFQQPQNQNYDWSMGDAEQK